MSLCARGILTNHQQINLNYELILIKSSKLKAPVAREITTQSKLIDNKLNSNPVIQENQKIDQNTHIGAAVFRKGVKENVGVVKIVF